MALGSQLDKTWQAGGSLLESNVPTVSRCHSLVKSAAPRMVALVLGIVGGFALLFFAHTLPRLSFAPSWFTDAIRVLGFLVGVVCLGSLIWLCRPRDAATSRGSGLESPSSTTEDNAVEEPVTRPPKRRRRQARWRAITKWMAILIVYLFVAGACAYAIPAIFGMSTSSSLLSGFYIITLLGPAIIVVVGFVSVIRAGRSSQA